MGLEWQVVCDKAKLQLSWTLSSVDLRIGGYPVQDTGGVIIGNPNCPRREHGDKVSARKLSLRSEMCV